MHVMSNEPRSETYKAAARRLDPTWRDPEAPTKGAEFISASDVQVSARDSDALGDDSNKPIQKKISTGWYWQDKFTMHFVVAGVLMGAMRVTVSLHERGPQAVVHYHCGIRLPTQSIKWLGRTFDHHIDAQYVVEDNARQFLGAMYSEMLNYKAR